ncbi:MAG: hypothetical protein ACXWMI_11325 [Syntrophales bacterium]
MTEKARTTANQPGVGAIPHAKGVAFRVWAPHAEGLPCSGEIGIGLYTAVIFSQDE